MRFIREDVLRLTGPIVVEQVLIVLMGVINAIMAARIGSKAVSGIGMVDSINNVFIVFISALAVGSTVVVAQYIGHGDTEKANETAKQGLLSGSLITIVITILLFALRYSVLVTLYSSAEPEVIAYANTYFSITIFSYPFIAISTIACGTLRGAGDTKSPMQITLLMNLINIVLSYILIYGIDFSILGLKILFEGYKVKGAAIGITISRLIGAVLSLFVIIRGSKTLKFGNIRKLKDLKINIELQKYIFGVGIPASVESLLFQGGKLIVQVFIVGMGTIAITANYVANSIFTLINIPGSAFSIAATTLVGQFMGKNDKDGAESVLIYLTKLTSLALFIICAVTLPLTDFLSSLYSDVEEVIKISSDILRVNAIIMPIIWATSFIIPAGLKGAGDARFTMITSMICMWIFRISCGYLFGVTLKLGVMVVWIGMYTDWIVRTTVYILRLKSGKWKSNIVVKLEEQPKSY